MSLLERARRERKERDADVAAREAACLRRSQELYAAKLSYILETEVDPASWKLGRGARLSSMGGDIASPMTTRIEGVKVTGEHEYFSSSSSWRTTFMVSGRAFHSLAQFAEAVDG